MSEIIHALTVGAVAGCTTVILTNPIDMAKTRLQLQGELQRKSNYTPKITGVIDCLRKTAQHEGILSLQKGLVPALYFQIIMNGIRLGMYDRLKGNVANQVSTTYRPVANAFTSGMLGWVGGFLGSPFNMIKTRLMLQSKFLDNGNRYEYTGFTNAVISIFKRDGQRKNITQMSLKGLFSGSMLWGVRTGMGSAVQLPIFDKCKEVILPKIPGLPGLMCCSAISTFWLCTLMCPIDGLSTRYFNQPFDSDGKGLLYRNVWEGTSRILQTEGFFGLYKGFIALLARAGPQSFLTLVIFSYLMGR